MARIPLHKNTREVSDMEILDHHMDMRGLRRDDGGFTKHKTGRHKKQRGLEGMTRMEHLAEKAFSND